MKKAIWAGCLVVVGAGFAGGTVYTGKLVNAEYQRYVAAITENYQGVAKVSSTVNNGFWGSENTLSVEFLDLPKSVVDWAGTNTVNFNIVYTHSFLSSSSVMTIADTELLQKIKPLQVNGDKELLVVNSDYRYDFGAGQVAVTGDIQVDALRFEDKGKQLEIGVSKGVYQLTQGALELEWLVAPSKLASGTFKVDIGEIALKESAQVESGDVLTASVTQSSLGDFSVASVRYTADSAELLIQSIVMKLKQHIEGERVVLDVDYHTEYVEIDDKRKKIRFDEPQLQLMLDLDLASVIRFVEKLQELQEQTGEAFDYPEQVIGHLSTIADQGVNLDLKRLSVALAGETLLANAKLKLEARNGGVAPKSPIENMDLIAMINAPKKFLQAMPDYNPAQIQMMVGFGVLVEKGDSYVAEFTVKDGKALMNGASVPGM